MRNGLKVGQLALSIALTAQLVAGMSLVPAFAVNFRDVSGHWAQSAIENLSNQNVLGGYPDGTFRPEAPVTRAEFSSMIFKSLNLAPSSDPYTSFYDVPPSHWAHTAIEAVKDRGYVSGYPGNVFRPTQNISRVEAISVLANASGGVTVDSQRANQILNQYGDAGQVPQWARPAVASAVEKGIVENRPWSQNRLEPNRPATRAEVAAMLENLRAFENVARGGGNVNYQAQNQAQGQTDVNTGMTMNGQVLRGYVATVPAQTQFTATLNTPIHSELNNVGDTVRLTLSQPLVSQQGQVVVPAGSEVLGTIRELEESGRLNRDARMNIDFNEIITPMGQRVTIFGTVATEDGTLRASTTGKRIGKAVGTTAVGAGLGAALGTAMGPLSGGSVGRGAIYGTAVGAGVGAIAAAADKGKELVLEAGTPIDIRLQRPIVVESPQ